MGYENCKRCNDAIYTDREPYEYQIICRKCKDELELKSKIKKVVIPGTEVEMVCSLPEPEFNQLYQDYEALDVEELRKEFKRIETPKPLADDEVSVEDCCSDKIYATLECSDSLMYKLAQIDSRFAFVSLSDSFYIGGGYHYKGLKEAIKQRIEAGITIYQIKDQETLFQWCLDAARRAKA